MRNPWVILTLVVLMSGLTGVLLTSGEWLFGFISAALLAWCLSRAAAVMRREKRAVGLLLESLRNDDYSRRLTDTGADTAGKLHEISSILRKIRKNAVEKDLLYATILRHIESGVLLMDSRGYVLMANGKFLELLGMDVITHIDRLSERAPAIADRIMGLASGGECRTEAVEDPCGHRVFYIHASVIEVGGKSLKAVVINDISREIERNETESWIKLTRVLVHEINNSLTPIVSIADMLKEGSDSAEAVRGLSAISRICGDIKEFVGGVRSFSHIAEPRMSLVELRPLLEQVIQSCRGAGKADICLECDSELMAWTDPSLLSRAVGNVAHNALQAVESVRQPRVMIKAEALTYDTVVIEVSNNGPHIPESISGDIFVPFFTTRPGGQGIGLALSRRIMIALEGNLSLEPYSSPDDEFTTFRFEIR